MVLVKFTFQETKKGKPEKESFSPEINKCLLFKAKHFYFQFADVKCMGKSVLLKTWLKSKQANKTHLPWNSEKALFVHTLGQSEGSALSGALNVMQWSWAGNHFEYKLDFKAQRVNAYRAV